MMESQFSWQLVAEHLGIPKRRNIDGVVLFGFTGITEEMLAHWQSSSSCVFGGDAKGLPVCYDGRRGN